jgi:acylphosphatase
MKRLEATIYGRVQGVFFRHHAELAARRLYLTGWVRNERDGTVKIVAEGAEPALQELLRFLRQGPSQARVDKVEVQWIQATQEFPRFETRR